MSTIKIKSLYWKNFRSYGEIVQHIDFPEDRSDLILLYGPNGSGKSSIQDVIDFLFFKKVRGKKRQWATLSSLPNRDNGGNLWARIDFTKDDVDYTIERGVSPNKLELYISGEPYVAKSKAALESEIGEIIGFDINAFKTFISVNANDFKNFIYMKKAEKRKVLDKIFNLDILNDLADIVKNFSSGTRSQKDQLESKMEVYHSNLEAIDESAKDQWKLRKEELKKELNQLKTVLSELKDKVKDHKLKYEEIESEYNSSKDSVASLLNEKTTLEANIKNLKSQLKIFEKDVCPTCKQDITEEHKNSVGGEIKSKGKSLLNEHKQVVENYKQQQQQAIKVEQEYRSTWNELEDLKRDGKQTKMRYDTLLSEYKQDEPIQPQFDIAKIKEELSDLEEEVSDLDARLQVQNHLMSLLQEDGIKGRVISSLVPVLNEHINEYLQMMSFRYQVEMLDDFSAVIKEYDEEIDPDQLSEGEDKIINIALMFSYLSIIRSGGLVNVLFIDEIFSYIDLDNISLILIFLREWISRYGTNVIVVNHQMPGEQFFDRTWRIERDLHSSIVEEED